MNIADRIELTLKQEAYITFKDHLDNFANNPTCRLFNRAKTNIGRVSKIILESINLKVKEYTKANQWKCTHGVSEWFSNLRSKKSLTFVVFDKVDFYPSISLAFLYKALHFAQQFVEVTKQDRDIILHARKSILFRENKVWQKKTSPCFDVSMGSFDGA